MFWARSLLLLSVAALGRRWRTTAAIAFGLAVAVKFLPVVLTSLYWRRVRIRDGLMALLVIGMLYLPFLERGRSRSDRSGSSYSGSASTTRSSPPSSE
jgi:hypothetical protein